MRGLTDERFKHAARSHVRINHSGDSRLLGSKKCGIKIFMPRRTVGKTGRGYGKV